MKNNNSKGIGRVVQVLASIGKGRALQTLTYFEPDEILSILDYAKSKSITLWEGNEQDLKELSEVLKRKSSSGESFYPNFLKNPWKCLNELNTNNLAVYLQKQPPEIVVLILKELEEARRKSLIKLFEPSYQNALAKTFETYENLDPSQKHLIHSVMKNESNREV